MVEILDKQYDLESRKYERVNGQKQKFHDYEDYKTDFQIRYCEMELFRELNQLRNRETVKYADFIPNKICNDMIFDGATEPTPAELNILHRNAMMHFKETEVPPR